MAFCDVSIAIRMADLMRLDRVTPGRLAVN